MLATNRAPVALAFEPKLGGWRTLVHVEEDRPTVRTRSGRYITDSVPELNGLVELLPAGTVLDGELAAAGAERVTAIE